MTKEQLLKSIGRDIAEKLKNVYPKLHGSLKFNFNDGSFCNCEVKEVIKSK